MGKLEVVKFKDNIVDCLVKCFSMTRRDAVKAVNSSSIQNLLQSDPEMAMHDSIESWSQDVYKEYTLSMT